MKNELDNLVDQISKVKFASNNLVLLEPSDREKCLKIISEELKNKSSEIMDVNSKEIMDANKNGLPKHVINRMKLFYEFIKDFKNLPELIDECQYYRIKYDFTIYSLVYCLRFEIKVLSLIRDGKKLEVLEHNNLIDNEILEPTDDESYEQYQIRLSKLKNTLKSMI